MRIHGIFSSYLGDDEFDVGKAVRWNSLFFDTEYIMDLADGHRTRAYIVDWAETFPQTQSGYYQHTPTFFETGGAAEWRKTAFQKADAAWQYDADDWVCFADCTEGMSCDDRVDRFPENQSLINPNLFWPWMEAEILVSTGSQISLPIYAFIGNSPAWITYNVMDPDLQVIIDGMSNTDIYHNLTKYELNVINHIAAQECYQSWTRAGWSPRLFKVSALRAVGFDWSKIDKFTTTSPADAAQTGISITSYAYARWAHDPRQIDRFKAVLIPLSESVDDGWRVRQKMSAVRPVAGLPFTTWSSADPVGRTIARPPPPPTTIVMNNAFSTAYDDSFANFDAIIPTVPGAAWGNYDYLQFLYPNVFRQNRREGLYFLEDELGPEPWNFYTGQPALTAEQQAARAEATTYQQVQPAIAPQTPPVYVPPPPQNESAYPDDTVFPVSP